MYVWERDLEDVFLSLTYLLSEPASEEGVKVFSI